MTIVFVCSSSCSKFDVSRKKCSESRRFAILLADIDFARRWIEMNMYANSSPVSHSLSLSLPMYGFCLFVCLQSVSRETVKKLIYEKKKEKRKKENACHQTSKREMFMQSDESGTNFLFPNIICPIICSISSYFSLFCASTIELCTLVYK